ncbi:hypothetical protein HNY42_13715 [Exiguobacterium sp. Helios]|uniref:hypothetical protein n=1 Tax=Exiguobacterium sp. Helios TaxID=2735868 RepID=UPI00165E9774|nr:hypothetical protein [Exiguobacterium sp. Helios]QNR21953.1 hypothetical protein HNY42_13715 [Exiguobacterium sp. Helios]
MTYSEKVNLTISIIAVIISIVTTAITMYIARKNKALSIEANLNSKQANDISMGALENAVSDRINNSKQNYLNSGIQLAKCKSELPENLNSAQEDLLNAHILHLSTCLENSWNAYENACGQYIDKKIDQKRFKKNYKQEIKQWVEDTKDDTYTNVLTSRYRAVIRVYQEWEDIENNDD